MNSNAAVQDLKLRFSTGGKPYVVKFVLVFSWKLNGVEPELEINLCGGLATEALCAPVMIMYLPSIEPWRIYRSYDARRWYAERRCSVAGILPET